jgi:hypothetical protein
VDSVLNMLGLYGNAVGIVGIVLGIIECFFGYRIFKVILAITGFIVGAALGGVLAYSSSQSQAVVLLAALVGGIIGAVLAYTLYAVGVFLIGALVGAVLGYMLFGLVHSSPQPVVIVIIAVIVGIVAVILQRLMIIVSTAFGGAWGVVSGLVSLTTGAVSPLAPGGLSALRGGTLWGIILGWLVLGIVGAVVQYRTAPKKEA